MKIKLFHLFTVLALIIGIDEVSAQGTAFTYQGELQNSNRAANGTFNIEFFLFNTNISGASVAGPVIDNGVTVSNGLFTATVDFGPGVFNGATNWLEIGVETNGASGFTTLLPRQQVTPTPYAIYANTASNVSGAVSVSQLTGTIQSQQLPSSVVMDQETGVTLSGTFNGNGGGLTNTVTAGNFVSAVSTVSQGVVAANTFQNIQFDTFGFLNGWTYFGGGSDTFTCQQAGTYLVEYGAEVATTGTAAIITIRGFNYGVGTEILGSESTTTVLTATQPSSVSRSFLLFGTVGTLLNFQFSATSTSAELVAGSGAATVKPSFFCTIVRIQ
jgi:hypothetical protein